MSGILFSHSSDFNNFCYCVLATVWHFFSHYFLTLTNLLLYYRGLRQLSALFNVCYIRLLRLDISAYTYRQSVAVVVVVAVVATDITMLSDVALHSDLLVVYVELGVALSLLLHRS